MMHNRVLSISFFFAIAFLIISCQETSNNTGTIVQDQEQLENAIKDALPGDVIVMANGEWRDIEIRFSGQGTEKQPITLTAETPGEVIIQGKSDLKLAGEYLVVDGLVFNNGYSPSSTVIKFAFDSKTLANHSKVTNCVIQDFNKPQRNQQDLWVQFHGRHNELSNCYVRGKSNRGPTIRVDLAGHQSSFNYHRIINNHFGPRPPKGGPSAETIQLGNSSTSMVPSYTLVAENLFEECNGEVEIISSKSNFNEFRNNIFYKSEGSLVTRHGNYCLLDGNYFIGDDDSDNYGGIRLIGTGHWVTNNYFYKLKGKEFRSPLAVMNGIPKSPLNRYIQVTDVVVAHNSWIDCVDPMHFGVGSNISQRDVLPPSEIRSEVPIRTTVANNVIFNSEPGSNPVVAHDKLDGITFKNNYVSSTSISGDSIDGFEIVENEMVESGENVYAPSENIKDLELYQGFDFETIALDLFGSKRTNQNAPGAIVSKPSEDIKLLDYSRFGPSWYDAKAEMAEGKKHSVNPGGNTIVETIKAASPGDIIEIEPGNYSISESLQINKSLTIKSSDPEQKAKINFSGDPGSPLFEMNPGGDLKLEGLVLKGNKSTHAFASLKENMSSLYNLDVSHCEISDFDYVLKAYKYSFSEFITFESTSFRNCTNGIELSEEREDKGEYNAENLSISNCVFDNVSQNVVDYYRGGYDESTVGGNLKVSNSTFSNCGRAEKNRVLLNTYGIINVDISGNTFKNNPVQHVAILWGAKNNSHANNTIQNSGKMTVEENLKLNLLY